VPVLVSIFIKNSATCEC